MSVLGIDVGTSTCKGIVLNGDGKIVCKERLDYAQAAAVFGDRAEIDARIFRDSVFHLIGKISAQMKHTDPIAAIAFSTHGETLIPVDQGGNAVCPAMLSMDRRCTAEVEQLRENIGAQTFYRITGTPLHSQYPIPKIMWMQRHDAERFRSAKRFCSTQDYLNGLLGAPGYVDYSLASRFGGLDVRDHGWSDAILQTAGIEGERLSRPVCAGTEIGAVPSALAEELMLERNVSIVSGGHDQPCAALGTGVHPGNLTVSAGSYECASIMTDAPLNGEKGLLYGLNSYCHVLKDRYITLAFFASGLMVQWFIDRFCRHERQVAEDEKKNIFRLLEGMSPAKPTGICVTPHIYGGMNPEWDESLAAHITGLKATDGIGELYRAVLEGTACELDLNIRVLERLSGTIHALSMSGGGTNSDVWMQLRADVVQKPVYRYRSEVDAPCLGAAILAGLGSGLFSDYEQAMEAIPRAKDCFVPDASDVYARQKRTYLALHRPGLLAL